MDSIWKKQLINQLEDYLKEISIKFGGELIPNITISRTLGERKSPDHKPNYGWVIGLGKMGMPQAFFSGETLEDCFSQVEEVRKKKDYRSDWDRLREEMTAFS